MTEIFDIDNKFQAVNFTTKEQNLQKVFGANLRN